MVFMAKMEDEKDWELKIMTVEGRTNRTMDSVVACSRNISV